MTQAQLDFHNMTPQVTQEQIDLQNQLEIHTADLITKPLSNDSPILFLDTKEITDDPIQDQMEHQNIPEQQNIPTIPTKNKTPSDPDQSPDTPPPTKKKYEIMKDPAFLSSPIYPPIIPTKPQLSTTRDDYLVPILSNHRLYTIDHSKITGYLRNYDPIKQYFCLLPHNDTSRPLIVPQVYLIHFDDFLLPCNIPTQIVKPLTVIKHLVSRR